MLLRWCFVFFAFACPASIGFGHRLQSIAQRGFNGNFKSSQMRPRSLIDARTVPPRRSAVSGGAPRMKEADTAGFTRSDAPVVVSNEVPKRRIALIVEPTPFTYVSGYKNRFQTLIRHLVEAGDEVLVITTGPNAPKEFEGAKVVQGNTFYNAFAPNVPETWGLGPKVWKAIREFKPDIIHATTPATAAMTAFFYARLLNVPYVLSYHTNLDNYIRQYCGVFTPMMLRIYWGLMSWAHGLADLNLGTSPQAANDVRRWEWSGFSHKSAKKISALNNTQVWAKGVDSDLFNPKYKDSAMRSNLTDGHPEDPLIIYVGRLGPEKNLYAIKDLMQQLHDSHGIDTRLAIIGGGPELEGLKKHYEGTRTVFPGSLDGEELSKAYASADVFFMPSESETLGFVVLEAMASATPVVAVRAGGIPDIIQKDGEVAFLYPPGDLATAAGQVANLIKDKKLSQKVGAAGREEVKQWDWRAATMKLRRQYNDAEAMHKFRLERRKVRRRRFHGALVSFLLWRTGQLARLATAARQPLLALAAAATAENRGYLPKGFMLSK